MAYKTCEDCGSRVYGGLCQYCDEEAIIFHEQSSSEDQFSDEFMKKVSQQDNNRKNR